MDDFGFQWHITDRCNRRCRHCYQERFDASREPSRERLTEAAQRIFAALPTTPISINLTGGEPLLYPALPELADALQRYPNLAELNLITNGTVVPAGVLERLAALPAFRWLKVSLESGDEQVNDAIRGAGHLRLLRENVPRLRERSGGRGVILMTTLGRDNVDTLAATLDRARELGADGLLLERFVPLGQRLPRADQVLSARGWQHAVETVLAAAGLDVELEDLLPYRAFWLWLVGHEDEPLQGATCNLGEGSMALLPDGTVQPCRRLPVPVGNLYETPFAELRARLAEYDPARTRPRLTGPHCRLCEVADCAGCRALALALGHGLWGADDACLRRVAATAE